MRVVKNILVAIREGRNGIGGGKRRVGYQREKKWESVCGEMFFICRKKKLGKPPLPRSFFQNPIPISETLLRPSYPAAGAEKDYWNIGKGKGEEWDFDMLPQGYKQQWRRAKRLFPTTCLFPLASKEQKLSGKKEEEEEEEEEQLRPQDEQGKGRRMRRRREKVFLHPLHFPTPRTKAGHKNRLFLLPISTTSQGFPYRNSLLSFIFAWFFKKAENELGFLSRCTGIFFCLHFASSPLIE